MFQVYQWANLTSRLMAGIFHFTTRILSAIAAVWFLIGVLLTAQHMYPILIDLVTPDKVVDIALVTAAFTGNWEAVIGPQNMTWTSILWWLSFPIAGLIHNKLRCIVTQPFDNTEGR